MTVYVPTTTMRTIHTRALDDTRRLLRELLRETAQSVVVVTAILPGAFRRTSTSTSTGIYHGATLSSFTSVALDPFPLVAFSLRIPSRMASALNAHVASSPPKAHPSSSSSSHPHPAPHLVINILSATQTHVAHRFARPDIHPHPFADPSSLPWTLSREGLPILSGALGALSCGLVGPSLSLTHLGGESQDERPLEQEHGRRGLGMEERGVQHASGGMGLASELYIARVLRAERVPELEDDEAGLHKLPLLYHRRGYTTVRDHTPS